MPERFAQAPGSPLAHTRLVCPAWHGHVRCDRWGLLTKIVALGMLAHANGSGQAQKI